MHEKGASAPFSFSLYLRYFSTMNKYFIFRREEVTEASITSSDTGVGMSVFAVPAESVSYMSAEKGKVFIVFNNATLYEEANLRDGESIKKSAVTIGCPVGEETQFIEDIAAFITGETQRNIMRFDVLSSKSTFKLADTKDADSITPVISTRPINMQTGNISGYTVRQTEGSNSVIAGIDFGANQPIVDYNHTGLASYSDGTEIAHSGNVWDNGGSGGAAYDISTNVGAPVVRDPASNDRGLSEKGIQFAEGDHLIVPTVSVALDYTLYVVFSTQYTASLYTPYFNVLYGDAAGETLGPGGRFRDSGPATKTALDTNRFSFRHSGQTGPVAEGFGDGRILDDHLTNSSFDPCHVFVIRRDENDNMIVHNRDGDIEVVIPAIPVGDESALPATTAGSTKGVLKIERLGTTEDILTNHFHKAVLARFGVIPEDIGTNESAKLAKELFSLYKS